MKGQKKMTDIMNVLEVTYLHNGVSILCYICVIMHVVYCNTVFFSFFPFFQILFFYFCSHFYVYYFFFFKWLWVHRQSITNI